MIALWLTLLLLQLPTAEMTSNFYKRPGLTIIHLPVNSVCRNSVDRNVDISNFWASSMITVPYFECAEQPVGAGILTIFTAYMKFNQRWPLMSNLLRHQVTVTLRKRCRRQLSPLNFLNHFRHRQCSPPIFHNH
jgi:hypothetical protein